MDSSSKQNAVQKLLARAHSPDSAKRIYSGKIEHRNLYLRPSPRSCQGQVFRVKGQVSAAVVRARRQLGLDDISRDGHKYDMYEPLHQLWLGYAREILGNDIFAGGPGAAAKLASAELHGALAEVVRSRCPGRVGVKGIVVRDRRFVMEMITRKRGLKVIPKEGTTFRIEVPADDVPPQQGQDKPPFAFEVLGDQLMLRSADRANRKFKTHFLHNL